jgi:hypothetical protein
MERHPAQKAQELYWSATLQSFCLKSWSVVVCELLKCVAGHRFAEVKAVDQLVDLLRVALVSDSAIITWEMATAHA